MALQLDDSQVETIREICDLPTSELTTLVERLTALGTAQQDACEANIKQWNTIKYGTVRVHGSIKGTQYDITQDRDLITYRTRRMLGYSANPTTNIPEGDFGSLVINIPSWFDTSTRDDC